MPLILIPIALVALFLFTYGSALTSSSQAQAHTTWYQWITGALIAVPVELTKAAVQLTRYIGHYLFPAWQYAEDQVGKWFAGLGQAKKYSADQQYRTTLALMQFAEWVRVPYHRQLLREATHAADIANSKNALTKAPSGPQRRVTQREADEAFRKLIDANFPKELQEHFPKFDWGPGKWRYWLGVVPALGGAWVAAPQPTKPNVHPVKAHPQPRRVPEPEPNPGKVPGHETGPGAKPVPIGPPQPDLNPHTDDHPNADPGTNYVPGVIPAKDKWARGQIVRLKKYEESTRRHLGPLATLALPIAAITTLIGLLECRNFGRFQRGICAIPQNIFRDLLGLLLDVLILADICEVITLVEDAFALVEQPLADFVGAVGGALCHGHYPEWKWGGLAYSTPAPELNTLAL